MATAKIITPPPVKQPPKTVVLEMSYAQAQTLRMIFSRIGGAPETTRRGHTDELNTALGTAGVRDPYAAEDGPISDRNRAIYFLKEEIKEDI